jgi:hypothetical protein
MLDAISAPAVAITRSPSGNSDSLGVDCQAKPAGAVQPPGVAAAHRRHVNNGRSVSTTGWPWRPALGSFVVTYVVLGSLAWGSYDARPDAGLVGWYTTIVWTLPSFVTAVGVAGGVMTAFVCGACACPQHPTAG